MFGHLDCSSWKHLSGTALGNPSSLIPFFLKIIFHGSPRSRNLSGLTCVPFLSYYTSLNLMSSMSDSTSLLIDMFFFILPRFAPAIKHVLLPSSLPASLPTSLPTLLCHSFLCLYSKDRARFLRGWLRTPWLWWRWCRFCQQSRYCPRSQRGLC